MTEPELIEFYGTECHFCKMMAPVVEKLEKEHNVKVTRYEVWHDANNAQLMQKYDQERCGGVPFFINTKTDDWICGAVPYERLAEWALGKKK